MSDQLEYLRHWWVDVAELPEDVFYEVLAAYGQKHRHYHGISHLEDLFTKLDAWRAREPMGDLLRRLTLDIFSHDVIYEIGLNAFYNEMNSAAQAYRFISERLNDRPLARRVRADILRTENHFEHEPYEDYTLQVLLDLDLSGLGSAPDQYAKNTAGVRAEVLGAYPEDKWRQGRYAFLNMALNTPKLFRTPYGYNMWEKAARANMTQELAGLLS